MKWGIGFASTDFPDAAGAIALAQAAEEAGFESLWAPQHAAVVIDGVAAEPGVREEKAGGMPDPLIWLTFAAAVTSRIRLATGVLILPQHNPVLLAKAAATLDQLSGGRLVLGLGVGNLPEEFAAAGVSFADRGRRADEYIEAMRRLWAQDDASYAGDHVEFAHLRSRPQPVRRTIPLHVGGMSAAAVARAARYGDGFFPYVPPPLKVIDVLPALLEQVRRRARDYGRDPSTIEFTSGGARTPAQARWFAEQGVSRLIVGVRAKTLAGMRDELCRFGEDVISPTADL